MKQNAIVRLMDAAKHYGVSPNEIEHWVESGKISLYVKIPDGQSTFIASRTFLDLLARGVSPDELKLHKLQGGIHEAELAATVIWLKLPKNIYKTLRESGVCSVHYFANGLVATESGLQTISPRFEKRRPFAPKSLLGDARYCLSDCFKSPLPPRHIAFDEVYAYMEEAPRPVKQQPASTLPIYHYASQKLEIALQTWARIWKARYEQINNKDITVRKQIEATHNEAIVAAKNELLALNDPNVYSANTNKTLSEDIAKLIKPDLDKSDSNYWFASPISKAIIAMIEASNLYWGKSENKQYGTEFSRQDIVNYMIGEHNLIPADAKKAVKIIQPDQIKRGRLKGS